jgi:hypothetical protein
MEVLEYHRFEVRTALPAEYVSTAGHTLPCTGDDILRKPGATNPPTKRNTKTSLPPDPTPAMSLLRWPVRRSLGDVPGSG